MTTPRTAPLASNIGPPEMPPSVPFSPSVRPISFQARIGASPFPAAPCDEARAPGQFSRKLARLALREADCETLRANVEGRGEFKGHRVRAAAGGEKREVVAVIH